MEKDVDEKLDILQIVKEDILEELGKKNNRFSLTEVEPEMKVSSSFISEAVKELRDENLVQVEEKSVFLTRKGRERAEEIAKKHSILEDYFSQSRDKKAAWKAASILEHYISEEVVDRLKKISTLKREGSSLVEINHGEGLITDITSDIKLFERLISMGILPGEKIKIANRIPGTFIVEIGQKKFALARQIAEEIKVLQNGED